MIEAQKRKFLSTILIMFVVLVSFYTDGIGKIIYVDADAATTNDGLYWDSAYWCLQDALADARNGDEIRVAQGTYKPDQTVVTKGGRIVAESSGDRTATFQLKNGVTIKGGYAGFGETDPDARDTNLYVTILSGDLNGDDGQNFVNNSENSYHVVTGSGTNASSVLEGFTVTRGNANGLYPHNSGGGVYNDGGSPRLTACVFTDNSGQNGGGMYNSNGSPVLNNCIFSGNSVSNMGGGMFIYGGQGERRPMLTNCIFSNNSALSGGGILSGKRGNAILTNCTFTENHNEGIQCDDSSVTIANSIFWNNSPNEIGSSQGFVTVTYSNIQGGWSGRGNINTNPMFVNASEGDYRLQPDSPCIDAGKNSAIPEFVLTDLDGSPRIVGSAVDMGTYEMIPPPNVFYVDGINGNDNNDGLAPQTALATIQVGIDAAVDGELVLVYPGLYQEEIDFTGKAITVQGVIVSPIGAPVLQNPGDIAVSFYSGEGPESILRNFIVSDSFMGVFIAGSSPAISNLTIVDNKYGVEAYAGSEPDICNSILWNNTNGDLFGCEARYSCIERGDEGEGNISSDPLFVEVHSDDYHLRSERGRYWREYDVWILDKVTSPCIDGGDPNTDPSNEPAPNGGRINMGAYGGTSEASLSLSEQLCPLSGKASNPNPVDGAIDINIDIILSWTADFGAKSHTVYFGDNFDVVNNASGGLPMGNTTFSPGPLELAMTYYWRVDEFDGTDTHQGDVWSFTTANFLVIDDFESYNDIPEGEPGSYRLYLAWIDGFDGPTLNGSLVRSDQEFIEKTIVHSGNQSMPFTYDNAVGKSEATLFLIDLRDWTIEGVKVLSVWFHGDPDNDPETMYVVLNGTASVDNDNPNAAQIGSWTEWVIDLQEFTDQGVNLASVNTITLGFGNRNNPVEGGSGLVYFDDIRLYRPSLHWPFPIEPGIPPTGPLPFPIDPGQPPPWPWPIPIEPGIPSPIRPW